MKMFVRLALSRGVMRFAVAQWEFFAALQRVSYRVVVRFTALEWVSAALQCVVVCFCRVVVRFAAW